MGCVRISFQVVPTWCVRIFQVKSYRRGVYAFFKSRRTDVVCTHFSSQVVPTWCVRIFQVKSYRRGVYAFFKSSRTDVVCTHFSSQVVRCVRILFSSQVVRCVRFIQINQVKSYSVYALFKTKPRRSYLKYMVRKSSRHPSGAETKRKEKVLKQASFWAGKEKKRSPEASIVLGSKVNGKAVREYEIQVLFVYGKEEEE